MAIQSNGNACWYSIVYNEDIRFCEAVGKKKKIKKVAEAVGMGYQKGGFGLQESRFLQESSDLFVFALSVKWKVEQKKEEARLVV